MLSSIFSRKTVARIMVTTAFFAVNLTARADSPVDAAPVLLSTKGNAPKWKNVAQLQQFAARGDPQACFELGTRYLEGLEVVQNTAQGITFLEEAAKGGIADASFRLGKIHYDGIIVPTNYPRALECYTTAAREGVFEAQHNIGIMLVGAKGVKRDYVEGLAWLILATKSGAPSAVEEQVRARLAKYPDKIHAAELRMNELQEDLPRATVKAELVGSTAPAPPASALHPVLLGPTTAPQTKIVIPLQKPTSNGVLPPPSSGPERANSPVSTR